MNLCILIFPVFYSGWREYGILYSIKPGRATEKSQVSSVRALLGCLAFPICFMNSSHSKARPKCPLPSGAFSQGVSRLTCFSFS